MCIRDRNNKQRLDIYFGGMDEWKKIPSKWEDFDIIKFDKDNSAAEQFKLDQGYDETKPCLLYTYTIHEITHFIYLSFYPLVSFCVPYISYSLKEYHRTAVVQQPIL